MMRVTIIGSVLVVLLIGALAVLYVVVPLWVNYRVAEDRYLLILAAAATIASVSIAIGFYAPWLDRWLNVRSVRVPLPPVALQTAIWFSFAIYLVVVLITAETIPLMSALRGATEAQLSVERGGFLKTRSGWQAILPYLGTIYVSALLPYGTARLFVERHVWRFAAFTLFTLYTLLPLEKSAFIFAVAPLVYLALRHRQTNALAALLLISSGLLYLNTVLARGLAPARPPPLVDTPSKAEQPASVRMPQRSDYFTVRYAPRSTLDHIAWRALSVPVVTAADAFRVFDQKFGGVYFLGATSLFVASATGRERINYDAEVFAHQFGKSDIGRANSVFFTEAYVNFGWPGIVIFSLFVGQALRWLHRSDDDALRAMQPLFCWCVFNAGLLGTLLSNGFAIVFAFALLGRGHVSPARK